jgi:hypothetical protein
MRGQRIPRGQLHRHLASRGRRQTPIEIDLRQLVQFRLRTGRQLRALLGQVTAFGITLRADRHVLADRHRHRPGNQTGDPSGDHRTPGRVRCGHADQQTRDRHDAIVGAQHRRP